MPEHFYDTVNLSGDQLQRQIARALSQELLIKEIFIANSDKKFSPSQMQRLFRKYDRVVPITSIRRALTNLTYDKYGKVLIKTTEQVVGDYGLPEHLWELNKSTSDTVIQEGLEKQKEQSTRKYVQPDLF